MKESKIFDRKMKDLKKLYGRFEFFEEKLNDTLHSEYWRTIFCLKGIEKTSLKINKKQKEITNLVVSRMEDKQLLLQRISIITEYSKIVFRKSILRFKDHAAVLQGKMLAAGIRGIEYSQLLAALEKLDYNIGEHERFSNSSLIEEGRIKAFQNILESCKFINKNLKKYNYLFA